MSFSIIFLGTSSFAVPSLSALASDSRFSVDLVITQPDRPTGRSQELTPSAVKATAQTLGLKIWQPEDINLEIRSLTSEVRIPNPDFLVAVSYGQLLSQYILDLPRISPINVHASLLPRWRGASPIQHAILAGDRESGVTVQRMIKQLDAGPILAQRSTPLDMRETTVTLHDRLAQMGAELLVETLTQPLAPHEQDESDVTVCRKLTRADGRADANTSTAQDIDRKVRALNPWPGVLLTVAGQDVKLLDTSLEPTPESTSIPCVAGTTLHLVTVQPPGKKAMSGIEWMRGRRSE